MAHQHWPHFLLILRASLVLREGLRKEERIKLEIEKQMRYQTWPKELAAMMMRLDRETLDIRNPLAHLDQLLGLEPSPQYPCIEVELHGGFDPDTFLPKANREAEDDDEEEANTLKMLGEKNYVKRRNLAQYRILRRHIDDLQAYGVNSPQDQKLLRYLNEWDKAFLKVFADWGIALSPIFDAEKTQKPEQSASEDSKAEFRIQGEYRILSFNGKTVSMKNRAGMDYVAYLLRHPRQEFSCVQLRLIVNEAPSEGQVHYSKMSGEELEEENLHVAESQPMELIDKKAAREIKAKMQDLMEELEEAKQNNNWYREEELRKELEQYQEYLGTSTNQNGRPRKSPSTAERARKAVTMAVARSLDAIQKHHDSLGRHLKLSIRNRSYLVYNPDQLIDWQL